MVVEVVVIQLGAHIHWALTFYGCLLSLIMACITSLHCAFLNVLMGDAYADVTSMCVCVWHKQYYGSN